MQNECVSINHAKSKSSQIKQRGNSLESPTDIINKYGTRKIFPLGKTCCLWYLKCVCISCLQTNTEPLCLNWVTLGMHTTAACSCGSVDMQYYILFPEIIIAQLVLTNSKVSGGMVYGICCMFCNMNGNSRTTLNSL